MTAALVGPVPENLDIAALLTSQSSKRGAEAFTRKLLTGGKPSGGMRIQG